MTKNSTKKIPRLRFKGFEGEWSKSNIGNILKIKNGRSQKKVETPNGANPIMATSGVIGYTNSYLYNQESVLIGRKGTINKPYYINRPFWTVDTLFYSELFDNIDGYFVYSLFNTIHWETYNTSTGVPSLTSSNISNIKISVPSFNEQQKIGSFFAKLDQLINLQIQKLEQLKKLKRGYLQKMFPQKGETIPRLRFSGFEGEWKEEKLGNVVNWKRGSKLSKKSINNDRKGNKVIHYADIYKFGAVLNKVIHWSNTLEGINIPKNSLIFPMSDVTPDGIARTSAVLDKGIKAGGDVLIASLACNFDSRFFSYYVNFFKNDILSLITGTTVKHINSFSLSTLKIKYPSLNEQKKLSDFFFNFDNAIFLTNKYIDELNILKKAYLQKIFC